MLKLVAFGSMLLHFPSSTMAHSKSVHSTAATTNEWLTTTEIAALLRVHPKHVYRLLRQGLPARRVGGQWRFSRDDIREWADQRNASSIPVGSHVGEPFAQPTETYHPALLAAEPSDLLDVFEQAVQETETKWLGILRTDAGQVMGLLNSRKVLGAIIRVERDKACEVPFASLRLELGTQRLGLVSKTERPLPRKRVVRIAVPKRRTIPREVVETALEQRGGNASTLFLCASDADTACAVVRGDADVGFASESWAKRLGLKFCWVLDETLDLIMPAEHMVGLQAAKLCQVAQSDRLRDLVRSIEGADATELGKMRIHPAAVPSNDGESKSTTPRHEPTARRRQHGSSSQSHWAMIARGHGSASHQHMLDLVEHLQERGLRVGGFLQVPSGGGERPLGYDLFRLSRPERVLFADRFPGAQSNPDDKFCDLAFRPDSLVRAWEWLREDVADADVVIVDGVGKLEGAGRGHFPALAWARKLQGPKVVLLSVRRDQMPTVAERLNLPRHAMAGFSIPGESPATRDIVDQLLGIGKGGSTGASSTSGPAC